MKNLCNIILNNLFMNTFVQNILCTIFITYIWIETEILYISQKLKYSVYIMSINEIINLLDKLKSNLWKNI